MQKYTTQVFPIGEESPSSPDNGGGMLFTSPSDRIEKYQGGGQGGDLYLVLVMMGIWWRRRSLSHFVAKC